MESWCENSGVYTIDYNIEVLMINIFKMQLIFNWPQALYTYIKNSYKKILNTNKA